MPSRTPEPELKIKIRSEGPTTVIALAGDVGGVLAPADRDRIQATIQPGVQLALDFTEVPNISGAGLRRLLLVSRHIRGLGGVIAVRGASEELRAIAEASGFGDLFRRSVPLPIPDTGQKPRERIDLYPTHSYGKFALRSGNPQPLGATARSKGVNFAVYSRHGTTCTLVLFEHGAAKPFAEIPFPPEFRVGDVRAMMVFDLDPEAIEYAFRVNGPFSPREGHRFDGERELLDPTAQAVAWRPSWGQKDTRITTPRARLISQDFDWEGDRPLGLPLEDLVIYEMHVRGFTRHPTSKTRFPGSYAGLREKIPHLVELGVNCVELLPIFEFDETEVDRVDPATGKPLLNYWGYNTLAFCAPKAAYAASGSCHLQADEFKTLVKELHRHGIEVVLDVVFNHTAEGNENGPTLSFKGLDNATYYMLTPEGYYYNFSGCGNTFNCNHPVVREFVLNCLRHWVAEYHVDGFRFDLASILGRAPNGTPLANPPLLESLALDPILGRTKLIAEAWDAGGLYQVGHFPAYGRWAEWNGKYRDCVRKFLKGDMGQVGEMTQRLSGSPDLYFHRGPTASINFVTCHDGFTLADVVSYNDKHNEANGEQNRDGANDNHSWNCGVEGPTEDPEILSLRTRLMKNALAMLFLSQGIPMLLMGDEMGRSQNGNNNAYCQDNELNWLDWSLKHRNQELFRFCQSMIAFRKAHPVLRHPRYSETKHGKSNRLEICWHGTRPWQSDLSDASRVLAFHARLRREESDDLIYAAFNNYWETLDFDLPRVGDAGEWRVFANTRLRAPDDISSPGDERALDNPNQIQVAGRSVVILVAR
ncbi:glycogen debranching protein GlgX [Roseiconus nitratireducens]|uniref:Glycogen debranching protein GlgX n=1 Tax=Roseiconus nitratireducens TaxID=2605748 RepID=A0A5M6CXE2_9BACT|nr:glycogen debranching protein GlgX [Roseiconus nitratireducens]KAA5538662.1 glycogen debranching protein GlgX [Roseiconus nitratireducens]